MAHQVDHLTPTAVGCACFVPANRLTMTPGSSGPWLTSGTVNVIAKEHCPTPPSPSRTIGPDATGDGERVENEDKYGQSFSSAFHHAIAIVRPSASYDPSSNWNGIGPVSVTVSPGSASVGLADASYPIGAGWGHFEGREFSLRRLKLCPGRRGSEEDSDRRVPVLNVIDRVVALRLLGLGTADRRIRQVERVEGPRRIGAFARIEMPRRSQRHDDGLTWRQGSRSYERGWRAFVGRDHDRRSPRSTPKPSLRFLFDAAEVADLPSIPELGEHERQILGRRRSRFSHRTSSRVAAFPNLDRTLRRWCR